VYWRKFKLDWPYTIGELLIVAIGVLIALAIDQWNDNRLARLEERNAIAGILSELHEDLQFFDLRLQFLEEKDASLRRAKNTISEGIVFAPAAFLRDIVLGANFGWNQGLASRATYDDLINSGKLGIIQSAEIRLAIADYYDAYEDEHNRIEERETDFPSWSYRMVPRHTIVDEHGIAAEEDIEKGLTDDEIEHLAEEILKSPIVSEITAEINLGRFIRAVTISQQGRAHSLIAVLEEYQRSND